MHFLSAAVFQITPTKTNITLYSETCIKRPRMGHKKWSLNRGGLLMEVKKNGNGAIGACKSGL